MNNFNLYVPTRVLFGQGQIASLAKQVPAGSRVLVTYGGGSVLRNGVMEQVRQALGDRLAVEFGGIEPNPDYATLMRAIATGREHGVDFVLAVGGGSVADGSKFIAAGLHYEGDPWELLTGKGKVKSAVPLGVVLTLAATGSEMNSGAVVSRRETGDKLFFASEKVFPRFAVLDPSTLFSLPERQTGNGVVDAFVHTIEQYLTYPANAKVQDRMAEGLLLTLIEEGPKLLANPSDYDARANVMWAATMALNGYLGAGVPQDWSTHMLGHEITAVHGLDHAQTLAIVLPAMLAARREPKRAKLLQYAERVWGLTEGTEDSRIDAAIDATRAFFERMGVPTRLSGHGIREPKLDAILAKLEAHGMTKLGEHGDVTLEVSRAVLESAV
ncbi:MAG: iron-containing alcohol dehydrogenase [Burkholderiales bacterium]|jgi:NADP-dependent alcohol dehydrogenase|nr:NADH-dependent alcohol dehydrogenase [Methylibium sp.]MBY0368034.1 iron-containing alcohol dehydrogenase [Burkholderiaceae bacterium]RTL22000.1 MAG: iron-containing alcohol dehydrogenase [Burkholderiales bacterium]|mmetsp:Transcript_5519/g.13310  ORF Transcript_5519/g.13310 Transcript_5519/m.13310 type:complete len:385 (-) Transcript_5519:1104-2258(-)